MTPADSHDIDECARLALHVAPAHLGHTLTTGTWAVTTGRIDEAAVGTYPVPAHVAETAADVDAPAATGGDG
jgi:hypothetical protein